MTKGKEKKRKEKKSKSKSSLLQCVRVYYLHILARVIFECVIDKENGKETGR
jgi:hypothetical protein